MARASGGIGMMRLGLGTLVPLTLGLLARGCGGNVDRTAPTIQLLTPEPGTIAHQNIAITGKTTGGVNRVEIIVDQATPVVAVDLGNGELSHIPHATSLPHRRPPA